MEAYSTSQYDTFPQGERVIPLVRGYEKIYCGRGVANDTVERAGYK